MRGLLEGLVIGSMGAGVALLAVCRRGELVSDRAGLQRLASISSSTLAGLSLLLLPQVDGGPSLSLAWIPGVAAVSLSLGPTGTYLAVMVFFSLALTLIWNPERAPPAPSADRSDLWGLHGLRDYWPGVAHVLCSLVVAALTLDQFLARYVVLELVALVTLLVLFVEISSAQNHFPLWHRYLQFRLGDVGLMLAILLLNRRTDSFLIEEMLRTYQSEAAPVLPLGKQVPIAFGGLLAAMVKMGLPPFHGWLLDSTTLSRQSYTWLSGVALPVLGVYLLYRLSPILVGAIALRVSLTIIGVVVLLWVLIGSCRSAKARTSGQGSVRVVWGLVGHGAIALLVVGTRGIMPQAILDCYLLTFIPIRVVFCILTPQRRGGHVPGAFRSGVTLLKLDTADLPVRWLLALGRGAAFLEERALEAANRGLVAAVMGLARIDASLIEDRLETANGSLATAVTKFARMDVYLVEHRVLEGINRWVARASRRVGRALQVRHTGRLRRNLLWASSGLAVLIAMALLALPD